MRWILFLNIDRPNQVICYSSFKIIAAALAWQQPNTMYRIINKSFQQLHNYMSKEFIVECNPIVLLCTSCLNVVTVYLVPYNLGVWHRSKSSPWSSYLACWPLYYLVGILFCFFSLKRTQQSLPLQMHAWHLQIVSAKGGLSQSSEIFFLVLYLSYLFSPLLCANNYYTSLLFIVCALRWYVKSLYRHFFLEDIVKHARVTQKMVLPNL